MPLEGFPHRVGRGIAACLGDGLDATGVPFKEVGRVDRSRPRHDPAWRQQVCPCQAVLERPAVNPEPPSEVFDAQSIVRVLQTELEQRQEPGLDFGSKQLENFVKPLLVEFRIHIRRPEGN